MADRMVCEWAALWVCSRVDSTADKKDGALAGRWVGLKVVLKALRRVASMALQMVDWKVCLRVVHSVCLLVAGKVSRMADKG